MLAECKGMKERGADLIELRLDALQTVPDVKLLLKDRPCPILITCRREEDGGRSKRSEADRLILLRTAIFEGADYVDLEYDVAGKVPRYGKTKRVISYHNFENTPDNIEAILQHMATLDADVLKICTMANCPSAPAAGILAASVSSSGSATAEAPRATTVPAAHAALVELPT